MPLPPLYGYIGAGPPHAAGQPMLFSRRALLLASTASLLAPSHAQEPGPDFEVDDQVIADPRAKIQDFEFEQLGNRFVWQDKDGNIWVGNLSPVSGNMYPRDGKAELVDTLAAGIAATGNGPEWVYGPNGADIVYTKFTDETRTQFQLARATKQGNIWVPTIQPGGLNGNAPIGSLNPNDPAPLIKYFLGPPTDKRKFMAWMELDNSTVGGIVPDSTAIAGRWVEGQRSIILTITVNEVRQVATYDVDTGVMTQLTFDPGEKNNPFMWRAPEFNNELVFNATTSGTFIGIYRNIGGVWTRIKVIKPPSPRPFILSPEPFVFNGYSFIFTMVGLETMTSDRSETDVWIAPIDPTVNFYRQVSSPEPMVRMDPEVFITDQGPFIYYSQPQGRFRIIHRCATGLGPRRN